MENKEKLKEITLISFNFMKYPIYMNEGTYYVELNSFKHRLRCCESSNEELDDMIEEYLSSIEKENKKEKLKQEIMLYLTCKATKGAISKILDKFFNEES